MTRNDVDHIFSVFLDCADMGNEAIRVSLASLAVQTYRDFEVILLGDTPPPEIVPSFADTLGCLGHPALAVDAVLSRAEEGIHQGDFVFMLRAGDRMEPQALHRLKAILSEPARGRLDLVTFDYAREQDRMRMYLPGWDPELLEHLDYIRTAFCLSSALMRRLASEGPFPDVRALLLCAARNDVAQAHVGEALLNVAQGPDTPRPMSFTDGPLLPLSIVIPNRNGVHLMPRCVRFLNDLRFPFELVVVDNASDDQGIWAVYRELERNFAARVIPFNQPFNYAQMINLGVNAARHDFVLLLNNDVIISDAAVMTPAFNFALRPEIGVVGSVLRYPDGKVQHAGMALRRDAGGNCEVDHILRFARDDEGGYLGALTAPRNWQCVTGAFQFIRKSVFLEVGGYDELSLPIEHNDVDFCLRVRKSGRRVVCLPLPGIVHDESHTRRHTRKAETSLMRHRARDVMAARWPEEFQADPFVHPDLRRKHKGAGKPKSMGGRVFWKIYSLWRRLASSYARPPV